MLPALGVSGKPNEEGIIESENMIDKIYPFGHQPLPTTLLPFGAQLGNAIVQSVPTAKWEFDGAENFFDLQISILPSYSKEGNVSKIQMNPFARVKKYWVDDRADKLSTFFRMADYFYKYDLTNPDIKNQFKRLDDGWVLFPNGDMYRTTTVTPEELKNK